MEDAGRGLRSGEEEARIDDLVRVKGKRKAAVEGADFGSEFLVRERVGERVVVVKSCRDCAIAN